MGVCERLSYATDNALGLRLPNIKTLLSRVALISRPANVAIISVCGILVWVQATKAAPEPFYTVCFVRRCCYRLSTSSTVDWSALAATQVREV